MLVCAWLALTRAPVTTDLEAFMPREGGAAALLAELQAGPAQRLILIGVSGGTEAARAAVSTALAQILRRTGLFTRVANGENLMEDGGPRVLFTHRYLLSPRVDARHFSEQALREALRERLQELRSPLPAIDADALAADPTREYYAVLREWESGQRPDTRRGVWFSRDGELALLLAETQAGGFDLDAQTRVVNTIERTFSDVSERYPATELLISGPPVFATAAQDTIRRTVARLSTAASLAAALILWLSFRSWRVLLLSLLPLASGLLVAVAVAGLIFGEIYGITLAFGMTLLGVAMDYPVHLFSHRAGAPSVAATLSHVWPILRLGVVSTALGYLAMLTADLPGLQQLGVFAVAGLLTAAAVTRWVLPVLLPRAWTPHASGAGAWMDALLRPRRWLGWLLLASCAIVVIITTSAAPRLWEDDLASLSPVPADALAVDRKLRTALGAPETGHVAVIRAADAQTALARSEALAAQLRQAVDQNLIDGFDLAARYLPSVRAQRARQAELPSRAQLQATLAQASKGLPFKPDAFEPFVNDVEAARTATPLKLADVRDSAIGARVRSLLFRHDGDWLALVPLAGVNDPGQLAAWFAAHAEGVKYIDLDTVTQGLMAHFRGTGLARAGWGALLIVALLTAGLRRFKLVLASVLPVALAVAITVCALLALEEGGLTLFHIVSLLLVVGICIDYSLFFSHAGSDPATRRRTLHAVIVCAASTIAVFAMLAGSSIPVLRAIGSTVALGVCASFVLALSLAPVLTDTRTGGRTDTDR
jgi:predicted exporter